jgi:prophage tail gpP-like protein
MPYVMLLVPEIMYCASISLLCSYFCHPVDLVFNVLDVEFTTKCTLLVTSSSDGNLLFWGADEQQSEQLSYSVYESRLLRVGSHC